MFALPTFLNAILLIGAVGFVVPLIIHLLYRTRTTTHVWGAMIFIDDLKVSRSRSWDWKNILLLLLRCAIPILLAICMARPLWSKAIGGNWFGGGASRVALLVDDSLSMLAEGTKDGVKQSLFDLQKEFVTGLLRFTTENSRWEVISLSEQTNPQSKIDFVDRFEAAKRYEQIRPGAAGGSIVSRVRNIVKRLSDESDQPTQVVLLSDFQQSQWRDASLTELFQAATADSNSAARIPIVFAPLRFDRDGSNNNLSVRFDRENESWTGIEKPLEVRLIVKSFREQTSEDVRLILLVDGVAAASRTLSLPGNSEVQTSFPIRFPAKGSHRLEARLESVDDLAADNRAHWCVTVLESCQVIIVQGEQGQSRNTSAVYLASALNPWLASEAEDDQSFFDVTRVSVSNLTEEMIADSDILCLVDVPKLAPSIATAAAANLDRGGIQLVVAGDHLDAAWYNRTWLEGLGLRLEDSYRKSENPAGIGVTRETFRHASMRFLNNLRPGSLESIRIHKWWPISVTDKKADVLVRFDDYSPWLVETAVGNGKLMFCTTACNDDWSNWVARPLFLPMMQQWISEAIPLAAWRSNDIASEQLNVPSAATDRWLRQLVASTEDVFTDDLNWRYPNSSPWGSENGESDKTGSSTIAKGIKDDQIVNAKSDSEDSEANRKRLVAFWPGIYELRSQNDIQLYQAVQPLPSESELALLPDSDVGRFAESLGGAVVRSPDEYRRLGNPSEQEAWRWLLFCVIAALFAELLIQRTLTPLVR